MGNFGSQHLNFGICPGSPPDLCGSRNNTAHRHTFFFYVPVLNHTDSQQLEFIATGVLEY